DDGSSPGEYRNVTEILERFDDIEVETAIKNCNDRSKTAARDQIAAGNAAASDWKTIQMINSCGQHQMWLWL
ncbi:MAG: hypothetical protein AAF346_08380, partial [Pseudomonadota bacterium]